jgi:hypothetical protein
MTGILVSKRIRTACAILDTFLKTGDIGHDDMIVS